MPTNSYPIHIDAGITDVTDKLLEVTITYPGASRSIDFVVVNGAPRELSPYSFVSGGANTLHISDITSRDLFVVFTHPTDLAIEDFAISNPVLRTYTRSTTSELIPKYAALHNFLDTGTDPTDDRNYNSPFNTTELDLTEDSILDMKLQPAYDGSVNIIFTDDNNPIRIVNSRFSVREDGLQVDLVDRRARKDANTYNNESFHQTELIPKSVMIPELTFNGLKSGGILPGGGYKYFFKYVTADGAETDIIEESRLVSVHEGSTTIDAYGVLGKPTTKSVSFSLSNLDQSFYGVVVYYTISTGEVDSVDTAYRIDSPFIIENGGVCTVIHTGFEISTLINIETLSLTYSIISRSKTLDVVNNRLLVGNSDALDVYNEDLAIAASATPIGEGTFDIWHHSELESSTATSAESNYSNPKFLYDSLGYWKGETYELGVVFITGEGLSPVYPVQGIDTLSDAGWSYDANLYGGLYRGFSAYGQNAMGVYRTLNRTDLWEVSANKLKFSGTKLTANITSLLAVDAADATGFFFVRRQRKRDVILQGLMVPVAAVPIESKFGAEYEISGCGNYCGVGVTSTVARGNVKFVPAPQGMMPFGVEETTNLAVSTDFYIKAPILDYASIKSMALYSPDIECAPTYYASVFSGNKVGISCNRQPFTSVAVNMETAQDAPIGLTSVLYNKITTSLGSVNALGGDRSVYASYVDTGSTGVAPKGFSGSTDRNIYCYWAHPVEAGIAVADITNRIASTDTYVSGSPVATALSQRPGNALAYGRYLGLKLDGSNPGTDLADLILTDNLPGTLKNVVAYNSLVGWLSGATDPRLGYVTSVYSSISGNPIGPTSWQARYLNDEDTEYFAISKRYDITAELAAGTTTVDLYGGDCYLGLSWKQVWSPLGIAEAPQTSDITAYKTTRRSLGLLPYGYAIPVPAQSNYNFNVRVKERVDEREYKVFGKDRSFLPLKGKDSIRGDRQFETGAYNHGYNSERSAFKQFRLNINAPFYRFRYPNRIYVSNEAGENEFVNGFSNFKGLNFKDYNTNLGAITKLISLNNILVAVFKDGVARIGVDERSMVSGDTGGVFVDNAQILARSDVKNSDYGCSHLHGVCASNNFVYGVDFGRAKIWRTNGEAFEIISDLKIQNLLGSITKELAAMLVAYAQTDPVTLWLDVHAHFDSRKNEIYFTFTIRDRVNAGNNKARTIIYNETTELWHGETDDVRKFVFQSNEHRYAFPSKPGSFHKIYQYGIINQASTDPTIEVFGEYNKFYDTIYDMYYDYHVIDEQALYKIYSNIYVVGNNSLPSKITYTSDFNSLTEQILKPYTNVRYPMVDTFVAPLLVTGAEYTQRLNIVGGLIPAQIHATQRSLGYGDFISIIGTDAHTTYRYVVIEYNAGGAYILVDKLLPAGGFVNKRLYFGYGNNYPMRLTDSAFEESYGVITCQFNNRLVTGQTPTKLRGKWMRFRHTYEGTAPVYISGVITDYGISLS